ncbi:MAG: ribosomal protein S18-alanine N-acetyltransferase [Eubacteriales bacterium]|nr:ribosomal protein S18-alanine N-acetyltransferase [Eubacteriales bacterium]
MDNWQIREMQEQDIEQVERIEKETFSVPWSEKSFIDACTTPENIYLVCIADGEVAGYCGLWTVLGEGNITNMAVSQHYRRKGVGKALMQEMEKRGRQKDVSVFFLEVRESNTPARTLYETMGYEQIGIRKRFYEKPVEDAVIMSKGWRSFD